MNKNEPILRNRGGDLSKEWYVEYYDNKGLRKKIKGGINRHKTKGDRIKAANEIISRLSGTPAQNEIHSLVSDYLAKMGKEWRKNTLANNRSVLSLFSRWLGTKDISQATITEYRTHLLNRLGPGSVNCHIRLLKTFFGNIRENNHYFRGVKMLRHEHTPAKVFTPSQEREVLETFERENKQLYMWALFMRYALARPNNEVRLLKVGDINFQESTINISMQNSKVKTTRTPVMPNILMEKINHIEKQSRGNYIISLEGNKPVSVPSLYEQHRAILNKLGYSEEYTPYSWKHTGAVRMYAQFKDIIMVQKQCGHTNPSTTYKYLRQLGMNEYQDKIRDFE